jgi:hypothetical protein
MKKRRGPKQPRISGNKPKLGRIPTAPGTTWHKDKSRYNRRKERGVTDD